jgi:hypothetical protein
MKPLVELSHVGIFVIAVTGVLFATDLSTSAVGTWKLNVAESKYSSGSAPKSGTRTFEERADGVSVSYEYVEPDGSIIKYGFTANFDGKDYPITGSGTSSWREDMVGGAETIALRRSGSNIYAGALKKSGNVVMTTRTVVSKDGKVTTVTASGADAKGQPTKNVSVWEKQ